MVKRVLSFRSRWLSLLNTLMGQESIYLLVLAAEVPRVFLAVVSLQMQVKNTSAESKVNFN